MNKLIDATLSTRDFVQDLMDDSRKGTIEYADLRLRMYNLNKIIRILQAIESVKQQIRQIKR